MTVTDKARRITKAKKNWQRDRYNLGLSRQELNAAIRDGVDDGMTQAEVARILGWPRQRVNSVVGES